ncbi:chloride channel protein [Mucilaginibacter segetis]|uniref:Chloride channel protein n=1 Tax=Mucilaginibacter segetis TaxID=2793071 RepID=A0A934UMF5_9SPHI|nr:chloride channel protein [Mucilaginibacter segetis]MBK0378832.1 chloride channel protein [Mucilaginibacter segetis]
MRKKIILKGYFNLFIGSLIVGILSFLLAISLKTLTAYFQEGLFEKVKHMRLLFVVLPSVGITSIYFTRKYIFKGKQNKGIKEIFQTLDKRKNELPFYKIPSHYINGFLTVVFGGSTGVEVSTVVATAAIGASAYKKNEIANSYKTELVCAGVAAGVTALFGSPIAGLLFAIEAISRKASKTLIFSCSIAVITSWACMYQFGNQPLFNFAINGWNKEAIPYMLLLSILAAMLGVYFTKTVIFIKSRFAAIKNNFLRVNTGALIVGVSIFFFPQLYGDSYHAIPQLVNSSRNISAGLIGLLLILALLKPLIASFTLGAGGDGGVFAPSLVSGAMLGILIAVFFNFYFHTHLIILNFALIGAAAMLSAALHAPMTALFLTCGLVVGGFKLFIPVLVGVLLAKSIAKYLCNYTVYSYKRTSS